MFKKIPTKIIGIKSHFENWKIFFLVVWKMSTKEKNYHSSKKVLYGEGKTKHNNTNNEESNGQQIESQTIKTAYHQ